MSNYCEKEQNDDAPLAEVPHSFVHQPSENHESYSIILINCPSNNNIDIFNEVACDNISDAVILDSNFTDSNLHIISELTCLNKNEKDIESNLTSRDADAVEDNLIEDFDNEKENINEIINLNNSTRKRKKRQNVDEKTWSKNQNKKLRENGEVYFGKKKINATWNYEIEKQQRQLRPACNCKASLKNKSLQCKSLSDTDRSEIFKIFWSEMTWEQRKVYINMLVKKENTKRERNRKEDHKSRREFSWTYFLKNSKQQTFRVCKTMFLNTLSIKERSVIEWKNSSIERFEQVHKPIKEKKETKMSGNEQNVNRKEVLQEFFRDLPKMESHYCRSRTSKLYLEPRWTSKSELYKLYKSYCENLKTRSLSTASLSYVFDELNLSLFKPKKDECDVCVSYRSKNISEEVYVFHEIKKNEAREAKAKDKSSANRVFCMDMQAVLLCPKSNTSALYFKMKLAIHNCTVFDMKMNKGYCFVWHEAVRGVTADNYASIICSFITEYVIKDLNESENIILYSDGCTSQNRNVTLSNALRNLSIHHKVIIEQKFLEKGHTQMEADHMHSLIERKLKNININVPAEYVNVFLKSRQNPSPFTVKYLTFDFFKNFNSLRFLTSIRPGRKIGDPTVTDLRALKYDKEGQLFYKIRHTDAYVLLEQRRNTRNNINKENSSDYNSLPNLYSKPPSIKKEKCEHLQKLKESIPQDFHSFYDNLTYH
ncbi:hypothetical protein RI129_010819 [Pyrocoelia pectoralis]|uniref:Uncharacterized protein n=1 Tax=Pyrocoelia pectoralis TaxID=417401 RepID=A0AAN7V6Q2_9COLE